MRMSTVLAQMWRPETAQGESLRFSNAKGGYFSVVDDYGLKVIGDTEQKKLSGRNICQSFVSEELVKNISETQSGNIPFDKNYMFLGVSGSGFFRKDSIQHEIVKDEIRWTQSYDNYGIGFASPVSPNTSYCFSANTDSRVCFFTEYDENGVYVRNSYALQEDSLCQSIITTSENTHYAIFNVNGIKDIEFYIKNIIVAESSAQVPYEPYCGREPSPNPNYPQEINCVKQGTKVIVRDFDGNALSEATVPCDLYEGYVWYPMTGKVVSNKRCVVLTGAELWQHNTDIVTSYAYISTFSDYKKSNGICNHFVSQNTSSNPASGIFFGNTINFLTDFPTVSDWKAWLAEQYAAGTPVKVLYELTTTTIEQYDPQPLFAPRGTSIVHSAPVDLSPELQATMLVSSHT